MPENRLKRRAVSTQRHSNARNGLLQSSPSKKGQREEAPETRCGRCRAWLASPPACWATGARRPWSGPRAGEEASTQRAATLATGLRRLFLCFSFLGKGCRNPLLPLPGVGCLSGRPPLCAGEGRRNHHRTKKHREHTSRAARQPTAKATGFRRPRKERTEGDSCGAPLPKPSYTSPGTSRVQCSLAPP